jgi:hypothetical protein
VPKLNLALVVDDVDGATGGFKVGGTALAGYCNRMTPNLLSSPTELSGPTAYHHLSSFLVLHWCISFLSRPLLLPSLVFESLSPLNPWYILVRRNRPVTSFYPPITMSRRYPTAERYEELEQDYYRDDRRSHRDYQEIDVDITRGGRDRELDFLREDYGRNTTAGPLVVRETRPAPRARSVGRDEVIVRRGERDGYRRDAEREEIDVTVRRDEERPRPPRRREVDREEIDVTVRRDEERPRPPRRREADREEIDVTVRREEERPRPPRRREIEREDVRIRRSENDLRRRRDIEIDDDVYFRRDKGGRTREIEKDEVIIRRDRDDRSSRADTIDDRESIHVRTRSRSRHREHDSLPPPISRRPVERDSEEVIIRRRDRRDEYESPSPRRRVDKEEIIIRRTEERSPTPPPPEPEPIPIIRRPDVYERVHQEIITHHRHIDHGMLISF